MNASKRKKGGDGVVEVDLAPLIDVTFLLIVFFMSIWQAAHIEVAAKLSLPDAAQGNPELQQDRDRLVVNVDRDGDYYVANRRLSKEQLTALLGREGERERDKDNWAKRPVFIRADADLPFGKVQDIMLICRDVRIWKLSLRTKGRPRGSR